MLNTGLIINGRYRIVKLLGQGGFGAVYRAWDTNLNQARALKINLDTSSEARRQFQREASTLAGLSHPNLPRVTDHFFVEGQGQFLVMDYADGEDLEAIMTREGQLAPEKAVPIITQIADALVYLHRQEPPIIHRDIKPANIRVTADGHVFLVDFGLAKIYDQKLRTTIDARAVTPGYSPPEQYGQGNTDARTDVYALAATLYTMLTGVEPQESVQRIVEDKMQPVAQINAAISKPISTALLQAMSLNPSQRYQNVDDFIQSLQQPQAATEAKTAIASPPLPGSSRSKRKLWITIAALFIMLLISAGVWFAFFSGPSVSDMVVEADVLATAGQYDEAIAAYEVILVENPGEETAVDGLNRTLFARTQAAIYQGNYDQAEADLSRLLVEKPNDASLNMLMADLMDRKERFGESLTYYEAVLAEDGGMIEAQLGAGQAAYELGDYNLALDYFSNAVAAAPGNTEANAGQGKSYYALGWYEDAISPLNKWSTLDQQVAEPYQLLSFIYEELDDQQKTLAVCRRTLPPAANTM